MSFEERSSSTATSSNAAAVSVQIPPFWPNKVALWFYQVEAQFYIAKITKDETKFNHVIARLESKYLEEIEELMLNPPQEDRYEALKKLLITRLSDSNSKRVQKLLETEELGDRTPSQFLRHLRKIAGAGVSEDFLVEIWKNRLPSKTQLVLAALTETDATKQAEVADRVHDMQPDRPAVAAVQKESVDIDALMEKMKTFVETLVDKSLNDRSRRNTRDFSRARSKSRGRSATRNQLCWYHHKFRENSKKCVSPCNWKVGNENDRQ